MTHIAFKNKPLERSFNNLIDDFLPHFSSILYDNNKYGIKNVPVNIKETDGFYIIDLIAPGLEKEDFKISMDNNLLTVSAEEKKNLEGSNENNIRREYSFASFKRTFTIDEKIEVENIAAKYINGILTITLPKKVEVKSSTKEITIL